MRLNKAILLLSAASLFSCLAIAQRSASDPEFAQRFNQGQASMASGSYEEARGVFTQLEKIDGSIAEVHASLGVIDFKLGAFSEAVEEIRLARKLKPTLHNLDALLAMSLAESGRVKEALPGLEKTFHSDTDPVIRRQAGLELTTAYAQLKMDRRAVETALELRDRYKSDPEILYGVSKFLGNSAYLTIQDLFQQFGSTLWAHLAEAEAYESQGRTEDAVRAYRGVLAIDPRRPNIHYRVGRTYLAHAKETQDSKDTDAAAAEFQAELQVNPSNANAAYELAALKFKAGDEAEAERLYRVAVGLYPEFEEAQVGLGGVLLREHKPSLAAEALQKATELHPEDDAAWYRLAQAERAIGNSDLQRAALAHFQQIRGKARDGNAAQPNQPSLDTVTPQVIGQEEMQP